MGKEYERIKQYKDTLVSGDGTKIRQILINTFDPSVVIEEQERQNMRKALGAHIRKPLELASRQPTENIRSLHEGLVRTYTPIAQFITDLMERAQYGDQSAITALRDFDNWHQNASIHEYPGTRDNRVRMQTVAHIAGEACEDQKLKDDLFSLAEFPLLVTAHARALNTRIATVQDHSNVWDELEAVTSREYIKSSKLLSGQLVLKGKQIPQSFRAHPILRASIDDLNKAVKQESEGFGTSLVTLGISGEGMPSRLSHALGMHLVQMARTKEDEKASADPAYTRTHIESLPLGSYTFAIFGYSGTDNERIAHTMMTRGIKEVLDKLPEPLTPKGIATCMRLCLGEIPESISYKISELRTRIASAPRALHSRGHRDDFTKSPSSALKRIGVDSLTFRQAGQEFDIEVAYRGSTLALHVGADGAVRFPPDIHDPESRAKIELIALSHLGEILDIHRKPREEPSTVRGGGKPKPYRGRHFQIQPEGKMTRQLAKFGTNASLQDWLDLPSVDMTWVNLAFNLAQEATHLADEPSDEFVTYLMTQDVPAVVAIKVSDLMARLKMRQLWPPLEGVTPVIRQVSFVDEMKDILGTGPIETNTFRAQSNYCEMFPPKEASPFCGTVFSVK